MRRLTEQDLADVEHICDTTDLGVAPAVVRLLLAELRQLRSARLTDEEREALRWLSFLLGKHSHEPYAYEGDQIDTALRALARLVGDK